MADLQGYRNRECTYIHWLAYRRAGGRWLWWDLSYDYISADRFASPVLVDYWQLLNNLPVQDKSRSKSSYTACLSIFFRTRTPYKKRLSLSPAVTVLIFVIPRRARKPPLGLRRHVTNRRAASTTAGPSKGAPSKDFQVSKFSDRYACPTNQWSSANTPYASSLAYSKTLFHVEVSHLSQTCRLLHQISHFNARTIVEAVECPFAISLDQALHLANAQIDWSTDTMRQPRVDNDFFAARAFVNDSSSIQFISDDAVRLAQAQLTFTAPAANHYCPVDDEEGRRFLQKRLAEARLTRPSTGPFIYFAVRYRASLNIPDAVRVLVLVATHSIPLSRRGIEACDVHPPDSLLPHEQARALSTWYFLKSYVLSYHLPRDGSLRCGLDAELRDMSAFRLYYLLQMLDILCDNLDDEVMRALGIQDPSPNHPQYWLSRHRQCEDWEDCIDNICQHCQRLEKIDEEGYGLAQEHIADCCDICHGHCKPREPGKWLWEL